MRQGVSNRKVGEGVVPDGGGRRARRGSSSHARKCSAGIEPHRRRSATNKTRTADATLCGYVTPETATYELEEARKEERVERSEKGTAEKRIESPEGYPERVRRSPG